MGSKIFAFPEMFGLGTIERPTLINGWVGLFRENQRVCYHILGDSLKTHDDTVSSESSSSSVDLPEQTLGSRSEPNSGRDFSVEIRPRTSSTTHNEQLKPWSTKNRHQQRNNTNQ